MQGLWTLDSDLQVSINAFEKFGFASMSRPSNFSSACRTAFELFSSTIAATAGPLPDSPAPNAPASIAESAGRGSSPRTDETARPLRVRASQMWPVLASWYSSTEICLLGAYLDGDSCPDRVFLGRSSIRSWSSL